MSDSADLFTENFALACKAVGVMSKRYPGIPECDLKDAVHDGFVDAVFKYNKSLGSFKAFAWMMINRAVVQSVRTRLGRFGEHRIEADYQTQYRSSAKRKQISYEKWYYGNHDKPTRLDTAAFQRSLLAEFGYRT